MDQWGFVLSEEQKQAKLKEIGTDSHRAALRKQNDRIHKWLHMLDADHWDTFNTTKKAKVCHISHKIHTPSKPNQCISHYMISAQVTNKKRNSSSFES